MSKTLKVCLVVAAAMCGAAAATAPFERLDPNAYQSFVRNWAPAQAPLCATISSQAQWNLVMGAAPTTSNHRPFAPPATFWKTSAIVLVAHVINAGDTMAVYQAVKVSRSGPELDLSYRFAPTPAASSTMKWPLMIKVARPLAPTVRAVENGRAICTLRPAAGAWMSPPQGATR